MSLIVSDGKTMLTYSSSGRIGMDPIYVPAGHFTICGKKVTAFSIVGTPSVYLPVIGMLTDHHRGMQSDQDSQDLVEMLRLGARFMRFVSVGIKGTLVAMLADGSCALINIRRTGSDVTIGCQNNRPGKVITVGSTKQSPTAAPDLLSHFLGGVHEMDRHAFATQGYQSYTEGRDARPRTIIPNQVVK